MKAALVRIACVLVSVAASSACVGTEPVEATSPCVVDGACERRESKCTTACDGGAATSLFCESGHWLASLGSVACTDND